MSLMDGLCVMNTTRTLSCVAVALLGAYTLQRLRKKKCLPPGPTPLPILGNLISLRRDGKLFIILTELSKEYGDLFTVQIGWNQAVVINSIEHIREALVTNSAKVAGRPSTQSLSILSDGGNNIAFGDFTEIWRKQRKVATAALRSMNCDSYFGSLLRRSLDKVTHLLEGTQGPVDPTKHIAFLINNVIGTMCFGHSFQLEDPFLEQMVSLVDQANDSFGIGLAADYFPLLKYLPLPGAKRYSKLNACLKHYIQDAFSQHAGKSIPKEKKDMTSRLCQESSQGMIDLEDVHLFNIVGDMFSAGSDTSRYTLLWALLYIAGHPHIQLAIQEEVDSVIGNGDILLDHKQNLPYTEAVIMETLRLRPPVPLALPHKAVCDTVIGGYEIPANTLVLINLWSTHHDPRYWTDPYLFNPNRFLGSQGQLAPTPSAFMPFSAGRRRCVGESVARAGLVLLLGGLCQRFSFLPQPEETLNYDMKDKGFTCEAMPYRLIITPRENTQDSCDRG